MSKTFRQHADQREAEQPRPRARKLRGRQPVTVQTAAIYVGMRCVVRGVSCRVSVIRACGTVDVEAVDGTDRAWRVSGLGGMTANAMEGR